MTKWIVKEQNTRLKFGPSLLNKVFTFNTSKKISVDNNEYIRGPIELNDDFLYEINLDLKSNHKMFRLLQGDVGSG